MMGQGTPWFKQITWTLPDDPSNEFHESFDETK